MTPKVSLRSTARACVQVNEWWCPRHEWHGSTGAARGEQVLWLRAAGACVAEGERPRGQGRAGGDRGSVGVWEDNAVARDRHAGASELGGCVDHGSGRGGAVGPRAGESAGAEHRLCVSAVLPGGAFDGARERGEWAALCGRWRERAPRTGGA